MVVEMQLSNGHAISLTQIQGVVGRIASELAVKEPTVILFNGEKLSLSDLEKNIYVQPGLLAEFDVDELAFWIAYCLIAKKNLNKRFAWRPLRFRLWDFTSIIVLLILVFTIRALNINDNWMIIPSAIVITPLIWSTISDWNAERFGQALVVTKNYDKASSAMRKICFWAASSRGMKPVRGWRSLFAKACFAMTVPAREAVNKWVAA